jgi:hypothetical protein
MFESIKIHENAFESVYNNEKDISSNIKSEAHSENGQIKMDLHKIIDDRLK